MRAKMPENSCKPRRKKKNVAQGDLTFQMKCQGIIIKNTIKFSNNRKFAPECPKKAFLMFKFVGFCDNFLNLVSSEINRFILLR